MIFAEVPREDPVNVYDLFNLVDIPSNELQRESFHEHEFNIALVKVTMLCDAVEFQGPVILVHFEKEFEEGDNPHFLVKRVQLFEDVWETCDIFMVSMDGLLEFGDVPTTKGVEQDMEPFEV